ncbi:hydrogenase nickel incorporation protein HypA [Clostridium acetireducens DSM 10703]|jgi:hydrogenase nickel incorporation protein HypA/HybF|uniref:Hydrogenase nickel incorporation protein HypA n=1 Tax=Clostridium acetireducens DSM 10703 TaxID=1121290 RepID=A0A1E8F107_9CLOT|nr:hydrogenase maturation nickel metallochaperone HypA [Clostridium acetireducens]OFI07118.1 hydrogenase nickel incorporation protein HypA [Clostridium acetireducens DSM 10703]
MHEVSIIYDTIEIVKEACKVNHIKKVNKIFIKVGEFSCAEEGCLKFAFDTLSKDTLCEGAELIVEKSKEVYGLIVHSIEGD